MVKFLLEKGADIRAKNNEAVQYSSALGHTDIVKLLLKDVNDQKILNSVLISASGYGHLDIVKLSLKKGADISYRPIFPTYKGDDALFWASDNGHLDVVKFLLEAGAWRFLKDGKAKYWACRNKHVEVCKLLREWSEKYGYMDY